VIVLVLVIVLAVGAAMLMLANGLGQFANRTPITEVAVGQCFDGMALPPADNENVGAQLALVIGVVLVECAEPHDAELAARFYWAGGAEAYPGSGAVESYSASECRARFRDYVGVDFDDSALELTYTYPLESQWATAQRSFECIVMGPGGETKLVGSIRDSRR
jgi:hypothetical protein